MHPALASVLFSVLLMYLRVVYRCCRKELKKARLNAPAPRTVVLLGLYVDRLESF